MKSGNLNFLDPSGPLQACNGTAFPLPYLAELPIQLEIFHIKVVEKIKTQILCMVTSKIELMREIWYSQTGHR